ncbi:MAG: chemotaxis-specific protein-glutamate methyltransferase CheB [Actinobacteria bacterium]|nr:chemotaxis-specific protein-glutamate methyltransferase CheB [Actinomycetota bacterium]
MKRLVKGEIKVLVVDDSVLAREIITRILESDPRIKVTGIAGNGKEAVELTEKLRPDLITMDIRMPVMDGLEAIKIIMANNPTPIIVITGIDLRGGTKIIFEAISSGALEVMQKPSAKEWFETPNTAKTFIDKVKVLSGIKTTIPLTEKTDKVIQTQQLQTFVLPDRKIKKPVDRLIAIAASTGGPNALLHILKNFPPTLSAGVVVVQHIASGFVAGFVEWLRGECLIEIREAKEGDKLAPGVVLISPDSFNIRITGEFKVTLDSPECNSKIIPSADVLFSSVAEVFKSNAIGVILTGMGSDGSKGIKMIKDFGGKTIAQDEESCVIFGMPKVAIEKGAIDEVLPLDTIAFEVMKLLKEKIVV